MHAHDRYLPDWFNRIRSRQITLPRFQRHVVWSHTEVSGLLTTVLRGLPAGAALILEVGDEEQFPSRTMANAPDSGDKVNEQLLDGQQRLTALWQSMHDKYDNRKYLIGFEEGTDYAEVNLPIVVGQARWDNKGKRYPVWADDPAECWRRKYIPISLLRPEDIREEIENWVEQAISEDSTDRHTDYKNISSIINNLRTKVREFNLPYLALPSKTPKEVALDVFVNMNTSLVKLSTYDIVVALVEEKVGRSLHEYVDKLKADVPRAADYTNELPSLVLDVVALHQDRVPNKAGYNGIDYTRMLTEWESLVDSIKKMVEFLEEENIFDSQRLPSYTAIPIVAALWKHLPENPDLRGNARHLLRKFLWRAFLTNRYEQASATSALQDYRGLRSTLNGAAAESSVPIFDEDSFPLPTREMLIRQAGWPKRKTILGRGLLALMLKAGAEDLADGSPATVASITSKDHPREYHHLFPISTLKDADIQDEKIDLALNCALITQRTNRMISNKDPLAYIKERVNNSTLGEDELRRRLQTHLIPYPELAVGYEGLSDEERRSRVKSDYDTFLDARAKLLGSVAQCVCTGQPMDLSV